MQTAHVLHGFRVPNSGEWSVADAAHGCAVEHVTLAARIDVAVVLDVHGTAPQVVARVFPIACGVAGIGAHQVGFVGFDANLIYTGDVAPEADEIVDFIPVAFHADHLRDYLHFDAALLLHAGEADEVVAYFFKARAFAVVLERLLGAAVEAEGNVFQRRAEDLVAGGFVQ